MAKRMMLVLGGARSGKSTFAEDWAKEHGARVLFVATAQAFDDEMHERIAHHRAQRPLDWDTLEAPVGVGAAVRQRASTTAYDTVVLDCVTVLTSNVMLALPEDAPQAAVDRAVKAEIDDLLAAVGESDAVWLIISNEVGMGVVPPTRLGRFFRDALGKANQQLARAADEVIVLVAGLPWHLK